MNDNVYNSGLSKLNKVERKKHKLVFSKYQKEEATFIPGIWTQSTAVPVALERNSAKVSSAMERSLPKT